MTGLRVVLSLCLTALGCRGETNSHRLVPMQISFTAVPRGSAARPRPPLLVDPARSVAPYAGPPVAQLLGGDCYGLVDGRVLCAGHAFHPTTGDLVEVPWLRGATKLWPRSGGDGCALWKGGDVRCWGDDTYGQIGASPPCPVTWTALPEPPRDTLEWTEYVPERRRSVRCETPVSSPPARGADDLMVGETQACKIRGGELLCWGEFPLGMWAHLCPRESLTDPPERDATFICRVPRKMPGFSNVTTLVPDLGCAVRADGTVLCSERYGAGGKWRKEAIAVWTGVRRMAAGTGGACAILLAGGVGCTGDPIEGFRGPMGDGFHGLPLTPTRVFLDATEVGAKRWSDRASFCALLKDRTVACWGEYYGETPVVIPGIHDVVELKLGAGNACARTEAGAVYCWGVPVSNELGPLAPYVPVPPMPLVIPP